MLRPAWRGAPNTVMSDRYAERVRCFREHSDFPIPFADPQGPFTTALTLAGPAKAVRCDREDLSGRSWPAITSPVAWFSLPHSARKKARSSPPPIHRHPPATPAARSAASCAGQRDGWDHWDRVFGYMGGAGASTAVANGEK